MNISCQSHLKYESEQISELWIETVHECLVNNFTEYRICEIHDDIMYNENCFEPILIVQD